MVAPLVPHLSVGPVELRVAGGAQGQATEIQIVADQIAKTKKKLNEILSANTGQPLEIVEKDTDRDNYMTAEEAKAYGLIDGVVIHK